MHSDVNTVCRLLEQDALRNLVTLKMLNSHPKSMSFDLRQGPDGWALLSLLEVRDSEWDRKTYPACKYVAFINGNSPGGKVQLLACLPKENLVLKTGDAAVQKRTAQTGKGTRVMTFHSFTAGKQSLHLESAPGLRQSGSCDERAWAMFRANGYEDEELARHFQNGAQWFGIESDGILASACLVFQNYKQIWEIGGVYTQPEFRRRGLGKATVLGALQYLAASGLVPRYQARGDNHASLDLARSCGLIEFLQMAHYLFAGIVTAEDRIMLPSQEPLVCDTKREELDRIVEMEQAAQDFIMPYSLERHQEEFAKPGVRYKSVWCGGQLIGFLILVLDSDDRSVEFRRVVVSEPGLGYGKRVVIKVDEICRRELGRTRVWLNVFETNQRARHVYEQCGYGRFGRSNHQGRALLLYEKSV